MAFCNALLREPNHLKVMEADISGITWDGFTSRPSTRKLSRDLASLAFDLQPVADFLCFLLAGYISTQIYFTVLAHHGLAQGYRGDYADRVIILAVLAPFFLYDRQLNYATCRGSLWIVMRGTALRFAKFAGIALALGFVTRSLDNLPRSLGVMLLCLGFALVAFSRLLLIQQFRLLERIGLLAETVAIVGAGPLADRLIHQLLQCTPNSIDIVGVFDDRTESLESTKTREVRGKVVPVGTLADLINIGKTRSIDWVLLTMPSTADRRLLSIVHSLKALAVPVGLCPQNLGLLLPYRRINYVGDNLPVTLLSDRPIRRWNAVVKSAEDLLLGSVITLLLLPIMGLIALAIKIDSPGPVLFRQRRHGTNNDEFEVFKFRTMRCTAELNPAQLKQTSLHDKRITPLGRILRKSSLDELPQLFNVLRGEMSLVGPRPHAINMRTEERLGHEIIDAYPHRHRVKPGMTGWAQVNGSRGATETREQLRRRVELDLEYVENWSPLFDLKILVMTFWVVLRGTNAR